MEQVLQNVVTASRPSELRITDIQFCDVVGAPMPCTLIKILTNQGLEGYGEVRDGAERLYGEMLTRLLIGQNPCEVDKIFRRIKQFGHHARQGGGVSGVEVALWDLAGKAYGVPVYQMLGGRFRDRVRIYCDTDCDTDSGKEMGERLKKRMEAGYTFLKMDLGISLLYNRPGALNAPLGLFEEIRTANEEARKYAGQYTAEALRARSRAYDMQNVMHPFTGIQVTELGLDILEQYVREVREVIGYEVPLAIDHFGHIGVDSAIRLGKRIEKYNIAWMEDLVPWQFTEQYARMNREINIPICTGEDMYLKESFLPLLQAQGVSVIHPDVLSTGGILETKKIADLAQDYGVAMALHMAETPIAALAAAHVATASENFLVCENHSVDVPWWDDMVQLYNPRAHLVTRGYLTVDDAPGLGICGLNDEVLQAHCDKRFDTLWQSSLDWVKRHSHDRLWS